MSCYLQDSSLSLAPICNSLNFDSIKLLVHERLYAIEFWQTYWKCVSVSKKKVNQSLHCSQIEQVKELYNSMSLICWNREEILQNSNFDESLYDLLRKCQLFEQDINF